MVTIAAIILIIFGGLVTLLGLLMVVGGALIGSIDIPELQDQLEGMQGMVGGILAVFGAIVLFFGLLELLSGIFVLPGRGWARIVGIVVSIIGALLSLPSVFSSQGDGGGIAFSVVIVAAYVFVVWALIANGRYFAR